eukprot:TRINITY_DN12166_c0_g1_i1.p1 TRINITY_DN12166_c0_g1~~TRINITY_DN12166_c0_g1_i1.p1  ORF type:complete len:101 (+),score=3.62 TRINITY_DN12166_c0_g1_i1:291-593(+)
MVDAPTRGSSGHEGVGCVVSSCRRSSKQIHLHLIAVMALHGEVIVGVAKGVSIIGGAVEGLHGGVIIALLSEELTQRRGCLLYTSPSPRDRTRSRMPSSA